MRRLQVSRQSENFAGEKGVKKNRQRISLYAWTRHFAPLGASDPSHSVPLPGRPEHERSTSLTTKPAERDEGLFSCNETMRV